MRPLRLKPRGGIGIERLLAIQAKMIERSSAGVGQSAGEISAGFRRQTGALVRTAGQDDLDLCAPRRPKAETDAAIRQCLSSNRQPPWQVPTLGLRMCSTNE